MTLSTTKNIQAECKTRAQPDIHIRDSKVDDLPAIMAIYHHAVLNDTGTFEENPPDLNEMARRRKEKVLARGLPYLVAERDGKIVGYCYASLHNERSAYRFTAEDSVYVDPNYRRQGIGVVLLQAVLDRCAELGYRRIIATIGDSNNAGSIAVHKACGYEMAGQLPSCGRKFDRWLDVVQMTRALGPGATTPPANTK